MAPGNTSPKKERLTLAQLTSYDDILTDALVDHVSSPLSTSIVRILMFGPGLLLDEYSEEQKRISFIPRNQGE
jgi:hypothetical protein